MEDLETQLQEISLYVEEIPNINNKHIYKESSTKNRMNLSDPPILDADDDDPREAESHDDSGSSTTYKPGLKFKEYSNTGLPVDRSSSIATRVLAIRNQNLQLYRVKELEDGLASLWEVEGELAKVASQPWPEPPDMMGGVLVYNPTKYNIKWSKYTTAAVGLVQSKWNNNNNNSIYHEEYYNKQALDDYNAKCRKKSKSPGGIQQTVATKTHDRRRIRRFSDPPIKPSLDLFQRILQSVQIIVSKATAASQIAMDMRLEKESIASTVSNIKKELLPQQKREEFKNGSSIRSTTSTTTKKSSDAGREYVNKLETDEATKLLTAVQKIRAEIEMLNLEKTDLKAEIVALEAKLAEAEILVVQTQEEKNKLALSQAAIHDCFEVDGDMQPGHHVKNDVLLLHVEPGNKLLPLKLDEQNLNIVAKVSTLVKERKESKLVLATMQQEHATVQKDLENSLAALRKEKEGLERECRNLQRSLHGASRTSSVITPLPGQQQKGTLIGPNEQEVQKERELIMQQQQHQILDEFKEFAAAVDMVLSLGNSMLTQDLQNSLRHKCGHQERILESLMQQREELEVWREELGKERQLSAAAILDLHDALNGIDAQTLRNQHPVNVRVISRVRALMLDKAHLQDSEAMVLEQTQRAMMIQSELVMPPGESHDQ
ncbi:unnamed protein product [Sphagnum jensenii]|uniref:Uncharacterized protein n=1 Tax=Sphagnum jensenii TaxID=128206 RepID=A0ABP0X119_9BRYO